MQIHLHDGRSESFDKLIGTVHFGSVPRKDEYIWFPSEIDGYTSWQVIDVAYWAGSGQACVYIIPILNSDGDEECIRD